MVTSHGLPRETSTASWRRIRTWPNGSVTLRCVRLTPDLLRSARSETPNSVPQPHLRHAGTHFCSHLRAACSR